MLSEEKAEQRKMLEVSEKCVCGMKLPWHYWMFFIMFEFLFCDERRKLPRIISNQRTIDRYSF